MSGPIVYDFNGISSIAGQVEKFVAEMNSTLDGVNRAFTNLSADSRGAWWDEFVTVSGMLDRKAVEIADTLRALAKAVGDAAMDMQAADQSAGLRISGGR
jgi:uncharacterized protein YukE